MRVFVYEYCTAVGLGREPTDPAHSLFREGKAMRDAVVEDFESIPGHVVVDDQDAADWVLLIAPETDGVLGKMARDVVRANGRLLTPSPQAIELTADKLALASHWEQFRVPTPRTCPMGEREASYPSVLKPRVGAGSQATFRVDSTSDVVETRTAAQVEHPHGWFIAQDYVPGQPASVAFLIGPTETVPLLPTFQLLSSDGRFHYEGGELPIPPHLAERAIALGRRTVACVPGLLGYVGVDLILGDAVDGSRDFAIEINPRLTTSYVGLRALADFNIAEAMLRIAQGLPIGELRWKLGRLRYRPDGEIERLGEPEALATG